MRKSVLVGHWSGTSPWLKAIGVVVLGTLGTFIAFGALSTIGPLIEKQSVRRIVQDRLNSELAPIDPFSTYVVKEIALEGDWGTATVELRDKATDELAPTDQTSFVLLHRTNGQWQAFSRGDEAFKDLILRAPASLINPQRKEELLRDPWPVEE